MQFAGIEESTSLTVNLLIFAAVSFCKLCLDSHFAVINFLVSVSSFITYIEDLTRVIISYEMTTSVRFCLSYAFFKWDFYRLKS